MHEPRTQLAACLDELQMETQVLVWELREWTARVGERVPTRFERSAGEIVRLTRNGSGYLRLIVSNRKAA